MTIISATKYKGNLFVGISADSESSAKKLGEGIETYNNFITRFVAKLFKMAIDVEIAGKTRTVNVISFHSHLKLLGITEFPFFDQLRAVSYRDLIVKNVQSISEVPFGIEFSPSKKDKLFEKMLERLRLNDTEGVKKYIRKGAPTDRFFYIKHYSDHADWYLNREYISTYQLSEYTPAAYAAHNKNNGLASFIIKAKVTPSTDCWRYYDEMHNINVYLLNTEGKLVATNQ